MLLFLIIVRTLTTIFSGLDFTINASPIYYVLYHVLYYVLSFDLGFDEGESITKLSHICCLGDWLLITFISCCFILEIIKNDLLKMVYQNLIFFSFGSVLQVGILLAAILHYEFWMFSYIYNIYMTTFYWPFKLIMICSFFTLLLHTLLQMVFLSYGECIHDKARYTYLVASPFFNIIMVVHMFCMAITSYFRGFQEIDNVPLIGLIFVAAVEVYYRGYAIKKHAYLLHLVRQCWSTGALESTESVDSKNPSQIVAGVTWATGVTCATGVTWATGVSLSYYYFF